MGFVSHTAPRGFEPLAEAWADSNRVTWKGFCVRFVQEVLTARSAALAGENARRRRRYRFVLICTLAGATPTGRRPLWLFREPGGAWQKGDAPTPKEADDSLLWSALAELRIGVLRGAHHRAPGIPRTDTWRPAQIQ